MLLRQHTPNIIILNIYTRPRPRHCADPPSRQRGRPTMIMTAGFSPNIQDLVMNPSNRSLSRWKYGLNDWPTDRPTDRPSVGKWNGFGLFGEK